MGAMTLRPPTCPSCGAPATGQERACSFCHGPVATVRCSACFHMNSPDFSHCAGCGRALGLEPIAESTSLSCPRCEGILTTFGGAQGAGRLYDCARCGGQLVEHGLLRELLERTEICGALLVRRQALVTLVQTDADRVRYLPCPTCHALMNRTNFGTQSGVIVDVCAKHGIWFDLGELPKVLDFVESGGLQRARRRQLERLEDEKRSHRVALARVEMDAAHSADSKDSQRTVARVFDPGDASLSHASPPAWKTGLWDDAKEAATEMLEGLSKLLRKNG